VLTAGVGATATVHFVYIPCRVVFTALCLCVFVCRLDILFVKARVFYVKRRRRHTVRCRALQELRCGSAARRGVARLVPLFAFIHFVIRPCLKHVFKKKRKIWPVNGAALVMPHHTRSRRHILLCAFGFTAFGACFGLHGAFVGAVPISLT